MIDKFKVGDEVRESCGCRLKILKVFKKSYKCISLEEFIHSGIYDPATGKITDVTDQGNVPFLYEKKKLDEDGTLIND